jgi:hypothetical protein
MVKHDQGSPKLGEGIRIERPLTGRSRSLRRRGPALRKKGKIRGNTQINKPMVLRIWSYVNGLKEAPRKDLIRQRVNTRIIQGIDKGSKYDLFVN